MPRETERERPGARGRLLPVPALLVCVLLALLMTTAAALGQPPGGASASDSGIDVTLTQEGRPSVSPKGEFDFSVHITVQKDTPYVESRLSIYNPGGSLMYRKTEVRNDVAAGTLTIDYHRTLEDLDLPEGRYPVELRVLATGSDPVVLEDRMLVVDDTNRAPLPVSIVVRASCIPARDTEGRFVVDPAETARQRDAVLDVARAARPDAPVALALTPVMVDDWLHASQGFEYVDVDGIRQVEAEDPVPSAYAEALDGLRAALGNGSVELLWVPLADPDLQGLEAMSALEDLQAQLDLGKTLLEDALEASVTAGVALSQGAISAETAESLAREEVAFFLGDAAFGSDGETLPPGAYSAREAPLTVIVPVTLEPDDPDIARIALDRAFDALIAEKDEPVVFLIEIGAGGGAGARGVAALLDTLRATPWVETVPISEAAGSGGQGAVSLPSRVREERGAPLGYWGDVLSAREWALALADAAGPDDPDAARAMEAVYLAESRCWAGSDGRWGLADRGRSYAYAAQRRAEGVLGGITLSAQDVTLAGQSGKLPVSIVNPTQKTLTVTLIAQGRTSLVGPPATSRVTLRPQENYVTVPITMRSALADRVSLEVRAGDRTLASTSIRVRASYIDRLAMAGATILVLAVLLVYIRRRVMT